LVVNTTNGDAKNSVQVLSVMENSGIVGSVMMRIGMKMR
jgi:hypothetical protein